MTLTDLSPRLSGDGQVSRAPLAPLTFATVADPGPILSSPSALPKLQFTIVINCLNIFF